MTEEDTLIFQKKKPQPWDVDSRETLFRIGQLTGAHQMAVALLSKDDVDTDTAHRVARTLDAVGAYWQQVEREEFG